MRNLMSNAKNLLVGAAGVAVLLAGATTAQAAEAGQAAQSEQVKPTIVLLHGAYADGSSWSGVTSRLQHDGYNVVAPAVPLRGIASDTSYLSGVLATIPGPKVLVGHSYGGALVSELADTSGVKSLVYVAAFIPQAGETLGALNSQFPGGELGPDVTNVISYPGDKAIAPAAERFMATRAGATEVEIPDASHLVAVSQPTAVTEVIERAAR